MSVNLLLGPGNNFVNWNWGIDGMNSIQNTNYSEIITNFTKFLVSCIRLSCIVKSTLLIKWERRERKLRKWSWNDITVPYCFATTRMDPRNQTHDDGVLHAWFIFNLHAKITFVFTQNTDTWYSHNVQQFYHNPCKTIRIHTYWEGQLLACGDKFPSTLVPSLVTTAPPFSFHPFPTPQPTSHYLQGRHQQSRSSLSGTLIVK
jgi:hypothetical protein